MSRGGLSGLRSARRGDLWGGRRGRTGPATLTVLTPADRGSRDVDGGRNGDATGEGTVMNAAMRMRGGESTDGDDEGEEKKEGL